jgi:hypothetical protein
MPNNKPRSSTPSPSAASSITRSPGDWIIRDGSPSQSLFALGPVACGEGTAWRRHWGAYTSHPHIAIGWATREEAEAVVRDCAGDRKGVVVIRRRDAVARFERMMGSRGGVKGTDWGTTAG